MQTVPPRDTTGRRARDLLAEHDARAGESSHEQQLREARQRYPNGVVYWDDELGDVVVDLSSGRR